MQHWTLYRLRQCCNHWCECNRTEKLMLKKTKGRAAMKGIEWKGVQSHNITKFIPFSYVSWATSRVILVFYGRDHSQKRGSSSTPASSVPICAFFPFTLHPLLSPDISLHEVRSDLFKLASWPKNCISGKLISRRVRFLAFYLRELQWVKWSERGSMFRRS